jgi:ABC-type amino acid transport substrate-binding protein
MIYQVRWAEGQIVGFDIPAWLAMADALGICPVATAELVPMIEAGAMPKISERQAAARE